LVSGGVRDISRDVGLFFCKATEGTYEEEGQQRLPTITNEYHTLTKGVRKPREHETKLASVRTRIFTVEVDHSYS
jgi:hypothetical protein